MPRRAQIPEDQKREALRELLRPGASVLELVRRLKISETTLHKWKKEALAEKERG